MKKLLVILSLAIGLSVTAAAQPRAIGARMGWGFEASYQHALGTDFVEADLGLFTNALNISAVYNFMIAQPAWTDRGEWGFYAGPGAAIGQNLFGGNNFFNIAGAGQVGLEYTFWFPLQLSFDIKAQIGASFGSGGHFYYDIGPALSVRYRF